MQRLKDKVAVITGGARGIGFATAEKFLLEGAIVIIWDVNKEDGTGALQRLATDRATFMQVNVADQQAVTEAVAAILHQHGQIDVLVNNAGITRDARLVKMTPEQWQQVLDVNLTGVFNCTQAVAQHMIDRGFGRILNASSVVGLYGNFGQSNYVATKAGVIGMTKVWARELGRKGITVNAVAPGFIATEMVMAIPEKVVQQMEEKTPMGKLGTPQDIANAYCFLASDEAAYINGAVLSVDGGLTV